MPRRVLSVSEWVFCTIPENLYFIPFFIWKYKVAPMFAARSEYGLVVTVDHDGQPAQFERWCACTPPTPASALAGRFGQGTLVTGLVAERHTRNALLTCDSLLLCETLLSASQTFDSRFHTSTPVFECCLRGTFILEHLLRVTSQLCDCNSRHRPEVRQAFLSCSQRRLPNTMFTPLR